MKHKLQEFVLQKKQREILNSINNNLGAVAPADDSKDDVSNHNTEMESTDAEVSSLLSSSASMFKVVMEPESDSVYELDRVDSFRFEFGSGPIESSENC